MRRNKFYLFEFLVRVTISIIFLAYGASIMIEYMNLSPFTIDDVVRLMFKAIIAGAVFLIARIFIVNNKDLLIYVWSFFDTHGDKELKEYKDKNT